MSQDLINTEWMTGIFDASRKKPEHPHGWSKYHAEARKFLKKKCEFCGCNILLVAHHIDQKPNNNVAKNIQTLCKHCHDFWHVTAKRTGKKIAEKMPTNTEKRT